MLWNRLSRRLRDSVNHLRVTCMYLFPNSSLGRNDHVIEIASLPEVKPELDLGLWA